MTQETARTIYEQALDQRGLAISKESEANLLSFVKDGISAAGAEYSDEQLTSDLQQMVRLMHDEAENLGHPERLSENTFLAMRLKFCPRPPWCR